MQTSTEWTPEQRELLKTLWPTSASAAEIGRECGGKSKGAVIGLANRMKLGSKKPPPREIKIAAKANVRRAPEIAAEPVSLAPITDARPDFTVQLEDLGENMCRWPYGDPGEEDFCYCGQDSKGHSFCAQHERLAYGERRARPGRELPPLRERRFR